jgi:hypothetical protein
VPCPVRCTRAPFCPHFLHASSSRTVSLHSLPHFPCSQSAPLSLQAIRLKARPSQGVSNHLPFDGAQDRREGPIGRGDRPQAGKSPEPNSLQPTALDPR